MIRKLYKITALVFALGLSLFSQATTETYSVRKSAADITTSLSFEVIDGRFAELGLGTFYDKSTRFLVKFGIEERQAYGYFATTATIDAEITVEALGPIGDVLSTKTEHLIIEYNPFDGINTVDLAAILDGGYHRYRVTIDDIDLTGVASVPDYVYIEGELQVDRFYDLDTENPPTLATVFMAYDLVDNSEYAQTGIGTGGQTGLFPYGINAQEVQLFWSYIEGAEEYELEWTWVDNYDGGDFGTALGASEIDFSERDFELNNTRVITSAQSYRIPLIYAKGYLIYRVRAVGRWTDNDLEDTDKLYFGPWTSDGYEPLAVGNWPHYIEISEDHEALKNWQYQAVYAEEGKKKEIVSYFDGSLRNRQTVTRINSNNEAIVGENVYDNQGRSSIQILPTPVENAALRYYLNLNRNASGDIYTHYDFDWDTGECVSGVTTMSTASGASRYYSGIPTATNNWQDYVPDAESIPFVQVEYTPDNTGRIRRQSGVGSAYTIDGERATEYFYSQPDQVELYRLFGYHVGNAQHYKKNMVVDANGQVSISIIDPQGRVIATALTGNNDGETEGETVTNLLSLDEHDEGNHGLVTRDLLNKLALTDEDTEEDNNRRYISGKQGAIADALLLNTQHSSVDEQTHEFDYTVVTDRFRDECMAENVYYPFAYDLNIDLRDDCGNDRFPGVDHDSNEETDPIHGAHLTVGGAATVGYVGAVGTSLSITDDPSLAAFLQTGTYTLSKLIQVNPDTLEKHLEHYLANLEPECLPDFFEDNTDCEGDEYPDEIDGEAVFGDFDLTSCNIGLQTMMSDLMPGGQYGGTDSDDLASIFHLENVLQQGMFDDSDPDLGDRRTWQNPVDEDGDPTEYLDENGDVSLVEVVYDDVADEYNPALREGYVLTTIDGVDYVEPQYLANSSDFIANWEGTWAKSLVYYHPEFKYYSEYYHWLCNHKEDVGYTGTFAVIEEGESAVKISSETYNLALQFITTFAEANSASNSFSESLVPASGSSHPIHNLDPYFNLTYPQQELLTIGTDYSSESVKDYKDELMDEIIDHYKDNNEGALGADFNLWEYAVKIVYCGSDMIEECDMTGGSLYPVDGSTTFFDLNLSTEQKDRVWNTYKQLYLAEKRKIDQILLDCYAIRNNFFNGYIGAAEPTPVNLYAFAYYGAEHLSYADLTAPSGIDLSLMALYLDAIEAVDDGPFPWFENEEVSLFAEKVKRFEPIYGLIDGGLPDDILLDDMASETDAAIYGATGQCGLLRDAEMFLRGLAENSYLYHGASVNSDDFPWLTDDLYEGMGGEYTLVSPDPIIIHSTISGAGDLIIQVENSATGDFTTTGDDMYTITLFEPDGGSIDFTWDWDDVTRLRMMYYEPESETGGVYEFQILAELEEVLVGAELVYREVVLTGSTKIEIGDCYAVGDLGEPLCDRDENFAYDIKAIFDYLYEAGDFNVVSGDATMLGGWYSNSEILAQMGDNPEEPISTLVSTTNSFTLTNADLDRELTVTFTGLAISDIALVTGASYNHASHQVTIYYILTDGTSGSTIGSVVDEETLVGGIVPFLNLDCMCDSELELAEGFEAFFDDLVGYEDFDAVSGPDDIVYFEDIGAILLNDYSEDEIGVGRLQRDDDEIYVEFTYSSYQCSINLVAPGGESLENIAYVYGITVTEGDLLNPFYVSGYAYVNDIGGGVIVPIIVEPGTYSTVCFKKTDCGCSHPETLAPQSCTEKLETYNESIEDFNDALALVIADADELYDASFPILEVDEFCGTRLPYAVDAYLAYLDVLEITTTEDLNYLSLASFAITGLNNYYIDENELVGGIWVTGTDGIIDPIQMYKKYLDDANPYMNWNNYVNWVYLAEQDICPPNALPYYPDFDFDYPCDMYTANVDTVNAKNQEEIYLAKLTQNFRERYLEEALASLIETFNVEYFDREYHYTLYYYDQAGNLIQTVPPKGVDRFDALMDKAEINAARTAAGGVVADPEDENIAPDHSFETKYRYNSLNQLVWQSTPDGGESYFGYDKLGRLAVSQNAKQRNYDDLHDGQEQFSYTIYDELGRIIEVGEMTLDDNAYDFDGNGRFINPSDALVDVSASTFPFNLGADLIGLEEVTRTKYDELFGIDASAFENYASDNTRNRITGVYYFEELYDGMALLSPTDYTNATYYDYDVHGNVKEMIQDNNDRHLEDLEQDTKKMEYEYDLVSGNVKHVTYQKDKLDQFIHEYEYDADNRITNVRTSHDNVLWEQDAKYFYYAHGPLARTEIGDKKVQASDYAYTIQGWLKGVNSEDLDPLNDQGKDAKPGINRMNGKDVYGYSLHYFQDDYTARHGNDFLAISSTALPTVHNKDLYNGNIKEMYTASTNTEEEYIGTSHTWYNYDQLNRIRSMDQERIYDGTTEHRYASTYTYDQNGNLATLTRDAWDGTAKVAIDGFVYHYEDETLNNKLEYVEDSLGLVMDDDLDNQTTGNYDYDEIGQLISDNQEEIAEIQWKVTGKVHKIIRTGSSTKDNLEFVYDAMGNRIMKIVTDNSGTLLNKTYYIRDAQGNCMSIYNLTQTDIVNGDTLYDIKLSERSIYGSSRVGTENPENLIVAQTNVVLLQEYDYVRSVGDKRYELSNHLGNVLEVVTDRKLQIQLPDSEPGDDPLDGGIVDYYIADVVSQSDYYPFGMLLPNTNIDLNTGLTIDEENDYRYSFQGQEKDNEIKGEGNSVNYKYRMHDPRVGRFFAVDPLALEYPHNSPYAFSQNMVIHAVELEGLEAIVKSDKISDEAYNTVLDIIKSDELLSSLILNRENQMSENASHLLILSTMGSENGSYGTTSDITASANTYTDAKRAPASDLFSKQNLENVKKSFQKTFPDLDLDLITRKALNVSVIQINEKLLEPGNIESLARTAIHEYVAHYLDILNDPSTALEEGAGEVHGVSDHLEYFGIDPENPYEDDYYDDSTIDWILGKDTGVSGSPRPADGYKPGSTAAKVDEAIDKYFSDKKENGSN